MHAALGAFSAVLGNLSAIIGVDFLAYAATIRMAHEEFVPQSLVRVISNFAEKIKRFASSQYIYLGLKTYEPKISAPFYGVGTYIPIG